MIPSYKDTDISMSDGNIHGVSGFQVSGVAGLSCLGSTGETLGHVANC